MENRHPPRLSAAEGRRFGGTVGGAFAVLSGVAWWRGHTLSPLVLGGLALLLLGAALLAPTRLGPVERGWMRMAHAISRFTTPILMGVVFYGVVAPIGALARVVGKNPIAHRAHGGSYWVTREETRGASMQRKF